MVPFAGLVFGVPASDAGPLRIGVAFQNRDGSWNLRFDYLPARMAETTIQLREIEPKEDGASK